MPIVEAVAGAVTAMELVVGAPPEERDLIEMFGNEYRSYKDRVSMLVPMPGWMSALPPDQQSPKARCEGDAGAWSTPTLTLPFLGEGTGRCTMPEVEASSP
jgi:hypothetical protein